MPNPPLDLEERAAPGMGRGLFATRDIPAGTAWCVESTIVGSNRVQDFVIPIDDHDERYWVESMRGSVTAAEAIQSHNLLQHLAATAALLSRVTPTPYFQVRDANLYMRANDGVYRPGMTADEYESAAAADEQSRVNAGFLTRIPREAGAPVGLVFVTLRDVAAGEELLVAYGREFWYDAEGLPLEQP